MVSRGGGKRGSHLTETLGGGFDATSSGKNQRHVSSDDMKLPPKGVNRLLRKKKSMKKHASGSAKSVRHKLAPDSGSGGKEGPQTKKRKGLQTRTARERKGVEVTEEKQLVLNTGPDRGRGDVVTLEKRRWPEEEKKGARTH